MVVFAGVYLWITPKQFIEMNNSYQNTAVRPWELPKWSRRADGPEFMKSRLAMTISWPTARRKYSTSWKVKTCCAFRCFILRPLSLSFNYWHRTATKSHFAGALSCTCHRGSESNSQRIVLYDYTLGMDVRRFYSDMLIRQTISVWGTGNRNLIADDETIISLLEWDAVEKLSLPQSLHSDRFLTSNLTLNNW